MSERIPVAILGATGSVGQRFVTLLDRHPWFRIAALTASERSAGKAYSDAAHWVQAAPVPERVAAMTVQPTAEPLDVPLVFSGLDASVAGPVEERFARAGCFVVSNARNHRMDADVPLLVPEVNPDHLDLVQHQSFDGGAIVTNPNCSTIGLTLALEPLRAAFGLDRVHVVSMQAVSGAGVPGVSSMEIVDNVIPLIGGEEDKIESEPRKIFGSLSGASIQPADIVVSAQCNRVPVVDGHTLSVSLSLRGDPGLEQVREAWRSYASPLAPWSLPSAPSRPVAYLDGAAHPQPRLHRDEGEGMTATVGRLRTCPLLGYRFVTVSHNTVRGAAGGALLCGELAVARGMVAGAERPASD